MMVNGVMMILEHLTQAAQFVDHQSRLGHLHNGTVGAVLGDELHQRLVTPTDDELYVRRAAITLIIILVISIINIFALILG